MPDLGITLTIANARLQDYLAAEQTVLGGQEFKFADGRGVTQANLKEIREGIVFWSGQVGALNPVQSVPPARGRVRSGSYWNR